MSEQDQTIVSENSDTLNDYSKDLLVQNQLPDNMCKFFSSESMIPLIRPVIRKISSDHNFGSNINYDDLCGQWATPETPAFQRYDIPLIPQICTWIFIEPKDMVNMKQFQDNKEAILKLFGEKVPNNILFRGIKRDIFLQLMWEVFRFTRDNDYNEISISSLLGLFYLTHRYFLTTLWRTAQQTFEFFKEGVLLHSVSHPPKSAEIFTVAESKQSLDLFCTVYMRQLALLRLVCLPNYRLILTLERDDHLQPSEEENTNRTSV